MSNEKKALVWLFDIGDEKLPSYMGIIITYYKDPYYLSSISWKVGPFFFCGSSGNSWDIPLLNHPKWLWDEIYPPVN